MKFLADENIPGSVVRILSGRGLDVVWVRTEFPGIPDSEVLRHARREGRIILTFDKDFGEFAVRYRTGSAPGIILFRLSRMQPARLSPYIVEVITSRQDWEGHFTVVEPDRIRMRPLPS